MNKDRRKQIAEVRQHMVEAQGILSTWREILETIRDDEQEYYENMPESFQGGEKGEKAQTAIDNLESVLDSLETIDYEIEQALESLDTAAE